MTLRRRPECPGSAGRGGEAGELGLSFTEQVHRLPVEDLEKEPRRADRSSSGAPEASGRADLSEIEGRRLAEAIAADEIPGR